MRSRSKTAKKPKKEMDEEQLFRILRDLQYAENDARTVFVGNVHYGCSPAEVRRHFESCGTVSDVDIKIDDSGKPKGIAFVEFLEVEAIEKAFLLHESQLRGRQIKVGAKWKKVPKGAVGKVKRPGSQRPATTPELIC